MTNTIDYLEFRKKAHQETWTLIPQSRFPIAVEPVAKILRMNMKLGLNSVTSYEKWKVKWIEKNRKMKEASANTDRKWTERSSPSATSSRHSQANAIVIALPDSTRREVWRQVHPLPTARWGLVKHPAHVPHHGPDHL